MRILRIIPWFCAAILSLPATAQVVLDMPAPPPKAVTAASDDSTRENEQASIAGYDTYEGEALYATSNDAALFRYAGFRNIPRITSMPYLAGRSFYDFDGPWIYPPIWGGPFFFTNHGFFGGFRGPPVCLPRFGFGHFGGFHGHFRFGGDHFRGHVRIGF